MKRLGVKRCKRKRKERDRRNMMTRSKGYRNYGIKRMSNVNLIKKRKIGWRKKLLRMTITGIY